jgi:diguanylate cyclase (GGDEF)-like protein
MHREEILELHTVILVDFPAAVTARLTDTVQEVVPDATVQRTRAGGLRFANQLPEGTLLVLPDRLAGEEGIDYLRRLRENGVGAPALVLGEGGEPKLPDAPETLGDVDFLPLDRFTTYALRRSLRLFGGARQRERLLEELSSRLRAYERVLEAKDDERVRVLQVAEALERQLTETEQELQRLEEHATEQLRRSEEARSRQTQRISELEETVHRPAAERAPKGPTPWPLGGGAGVPAAESEEAGTGKGGPAVEPDDDETLDFGSLDDEPTTLVAPPDDMEAAVEAAGGVPSDAWSGGVSPAGGTPSGGAEVGFADVESLDRGWMRQLEAELEELREERLRQDRELAELRKHRIARERELRRLLSQSAAADDLATRLDDSERIRRTQSREMLGQQQRIAELEEKLEGLAELLDDEAVPENGAQGELIEELRSRLAYFEQLEEEQRDTIQQLSRTLAVQQVDDVLDNAQSRRNALQRVDEALRRAHRSETPLTCMMIGIDRPEAIREEHGPMLYDYLLVQVAQRLQLALRHRDVLLRYGDETFVLLTDADSGDRARSHAERLLHSVCDQPLALGTRQVHPSVSIAILPHQPHLTAADEILHLALGLLEDVRKEGEREIVVAPEILEE